MLATFRHNVSVPSSGVTRRTLGLFSEDRTDTLSRNVANKLPNTSEQNPNLSFRRRIGPTSSQSNGERKFSEFIHITTATQAYRLPLLSSTLSRKTQDMADSVIKDMSEKRTLRISNAGLSDSHYPETPFHHKITQVHYVSIFRLPAGTRTDSGSSKCKS